MSRLTARSPGTRSGRGPLRSSLASFTCLLRAVPLFFCASPRTPLRVLCIIALDTIQAVRGCQRLSRQRRMELATFLDFQACTNAMWDGKPFCAAEYADLRRQLNLAGLERWVTEYLRLLCRLETRRPRVGGGLHRCDEVRSYREGVVRLSLATVAAIATNAESVEDGIRATYADSDLAILLRMAMQCQIVDDVVDYRNDVRARLPSFLTASASLDDALASTAEATRAYGRSRGRSCERGALPFETALAVLTALTMVFVLARASQRRRPFRAPGDAS